MRVGTHAVIAAHYDKSEAFTKAREPRAPLESVCDDNDEFEPVAETSVAKPKEENFDKVKLVVYFISLTIKHNRINM